MSIIRANGSFKTLKPAKKNVNSEGMGHVWNENVFPQTI